MHLEAAQPQDLARVAEIMNNAYRGLAGVTGWTHETELLAGPRIDVAAVSAIAARPDTLLLVSKEDGRVAGNVAVQQVADGAWYLSMLAVDPSNQQTGLGKRMVLLAEAYARKHGAHTMQLSVIAQRTPLIEWYQRRGYVRTGQTEPFPYGDPSVGTPLRDDLVLWILQKTFTGAVDTSLVANLPMLESIKEF